MTPLAALHDAAAALVEDAHAFHRAAEQEVRLMGAVYDVAAAFARCARACRAGESTAWFAGWSGAGEAVPR
jgi:hypothetical protein